jgi:flagellar hook-length control protein FliK
MLPIVAIQSAQASSQQPDATQAPAEGEGFAESLLAAGSPPQVGAVEAQSDPADGTVAILTDAQIAAAAVAMIAVQQPQAATPIAGELDLPGTAPAVGMHTGLNPGLNPGMNPGMHSGMAATSATPTPMAASVNSPAPATSVNGPSAGSTVASSQVGAASVEPSEVTTPLPSMGSPSPSAPTTARGGIGTEVMASTTGTLDSLAEAAIGIPTEGPADWQDPVMTTTQATQALRLRAMQGGLAGGVSQAPAAGVAPAAAAAVTDAGPALGELASTVAAMQLRQRSTASDGSVAPFADPTAALADMGVSPAGDPTADVAAAAAPMSAATVDAADVPTALPAAAAGVPAPHVAPAQHLEHAKSLDAAATTLTPAAPTAAHEPRLAPVAVAAPERPAPLRDPQGDGNPMDRAIASQVSRAAARIASGEGPILVVRLTPIELGTVRIELREIGGQLTARLHAEDPAVRETLERMLPTVRHDLRAGDSRLADVAVSPPSQPDRQERQERQQQQSSQDGARDGNRPQQDGRDDHRRRAQQRFLDALAAVPALGLPANGTAAA